MVLIKVKNQVSIPDYCPRCGDKFYHVNALDTKAKSYIIFCRNPKCRYCREFKLCPNCGELICL